MCCVVVRDVRMCGEFVKGGVIYIVKQNIPINNI